MTRRRFHKSVTAGAIVGLVALSVAGCGRRGPLEAAPNPLVEEAKAKDPSARPKKPKRTRIKPPTAPFILDPLV